MARLHLLRDIQILNAARRPSHYMMGDGGNLYLRVLPGKYVDKRDGKDWWFRYQINGVTSKLALGSYTDVGTKAARDKAAKLRKQLDAGINPKLKRFEDEAERAAVARDPQTVAEAFTDWTTKRLSARKDGGKEVVRMFTKDVIPAIGTLPIKSIRRSDITSILDTVRARGSKRMTGQLLSELRLFVNHAIDREWIEADITARLKASTWDGQTRQRKRVLADDEISELVRRLSNSSVKKSTKAAIWIMLSTMCRVGALEAARWDEIDLEKRTWRAARKSQEEDEYTIFLSPFALRYFQLIKTEQEDLIRRRREGGETVDMERYEWVFPAKNPRPSGTPKHVTKKTLSKQIYSYQVMKQYKNRPLAIGALTLPGGKWSAHDLRRTGSTIMARKPLGVDENVRELCLNHGPKNPLDRIYNQNKYEAEMRVAWERLGDVLADLQVRASG